jgi:hypothetical protein
MFLLVLGAQKIRLLFMALFVTDPSGVVLTYVFCEIEETLLNHLAT